MSQLITLQARKDAQGTHFYKDGKHYATIPMNQPQPRTNRKTITLNGWKWGVAWETLKPANTLSNH